jgi:hypothetical protein
VQRRLLRKLYWDAGQFFETPHDNKPDFMLNITGYVDESQHTGPGHAVVAGFWGNEEQWKSFADAWKVGLGKRHALHMKDLRWNGRGAKNNVRDLLARLGPIPYQYGLKPVYGAVKSSDFLDLVDGQTDFEKKLCGYSICLSILLSRLTHLPPHAKIKIVCEQQTFYEPLARALFDSMSNLVAKDVHNPFFSEIGFIPKDASALTQPADFLAFAMGKYLDDRGSKKDLWCRPIFGNTQPNKILGSTYPRAKIRAYVLTVMNNVKTGRPVGAIDFGKFLRKTGLL